MDIVTSLIWGAIALVAILFCMWLKGEKQKCTRVFMWVCIVNILACVVEAITYVKRPAWMSESVYYASAFIDYTVGEVLIILFYYYSYCYIKDRTRINKWFYLGPMSLMLISFVLTVVNILTGGVFAVVDDIFVETTGKSDLSYAVEILSSFILPVIAFSKRKEIGITAVYFLGLFTVFPMITTFFYAVFGGDDYTFVCSVLAIFLGYMMLESRLAEEQEHMQRMDLEKSHALLEQLTVEQEAKLKEIKELNNALILNQKYLKEASRRAEEASMAKTRFLFNMSHDIRTPMNAIMGYAELIRKNVANSAKVEDYIGKVIVSSRFLLGLINNVLDMSRIESGKMTLEEEPFEIKQFGQDVRDVYADSVKKKNITLDIVSNVTVKSVYCDHTKIKQIFLNLVSNAVKYTPEGGNITITVQQNPSRRKGNICLQVRISDTGVGISKEFLPKLFTEFEREISYTDNKIEGSGLGLPIVKKLVELMGGTIKVESELGKGSTFIVNLEVRVVDTGSTDAASQTDEVADCEFAGKRILMAEDNAFNAEIAKEIISSMGVEIDVAEDGVVCVDMLAKSAPGHYDMVLMDIQMPNMNGYEASRKIRAMKDENKANIPIYALTANAFEEDKRNALDAGMDGHLSKPIEMPALIQTLRKILGMLLLAILPYNVFAQASSESEPSFWEKVYMPIEMGAGYRINNREQGAYQLVTSLEYRPNREKGVFFVAEYDEHTHAYKDVDQTETNVVKGDVQYTDVLLGAGWRQKVGGPINVSSLAQIGATYSNLKHMAMTDGTNYYLTDNDATVPSFKLSIGLEYAFSPAYNIFLKGAYLHHLQPTQLEHSGTARGMFSITAGVNFSLF